MKNKIIFNISFSGIMVALGMILPFLTGQIPEFGNMLCPMHIPVFICGLVCGWKYGLVVGFIIPLLRSSIFGMPPFYPTAISMSIELATYGFISGLLIKIFEEKNIKIEISVFIVLIIAMIIGRINWGLVRYLLSIFDKSNVFNLEIFFVSAFANAWPGIILHLVLIPILVITLDKITSIKH